MNVQNRGDWAATFVIDLLNGSTGTLATVAFNYQGLTAGGDNQSGGRAIPFSITVNGNAFDTTKSTSATVGAGSLSFTGSAGLVAGSNTIVITTDAYIENVGWNIGIDNLQFDGTVVPEPGSLALLGLGGLLIARRRRG